jgi:type II secretory pathway component PulF
MNPIDYKIRKMQFGEKQRLSTYRKLAKFMKNGVSLRETLDTMYNFASEEGKKPHTPQALALDEWRRGVAEGRRIGDTMKGWVPQRDVTIISSGEQAGKLETALENAIFLQLGAKKIKAAIIKGLAYPAVLFLVAIIFMYIAATKIVPAFSDVVPKEQWVGTGRSMAVMADMVNAGLIPAIMFLVAATIGLIVALPRWQGKIRARLDSYPPFSIYRLSTGAGFLLTMAALVKAGVAIPQALELIRMNASPWYKERLTATLRQMNNGANLGEALYRTKLNFPEREAVADLRAYAGMKGFDESLQLLGQEWMEDSVERIEAQSGLIRNFAMILMAGIFGWIASGIFSLQQQIASGI